MSIKVTFEFESAAGAAAFLQDFDSPQEITDGDAPVKDKPRRGRPPKVAAPVDPTPAATPAPTATVAAPAASTAPAPVQAETAPAVPFAALVEPLTALADKDLDAAMAILAKYGVKKASELKPAQFGEVLAAVNAALVPTKTSLI